MPAAAVAKPDSGRSPAPARHAVILAGGSGTRLWPLSRSLFPKQLLAFSGGMTLLQLSVRRVLKLFDPANIWVVTNEEHVFEVRSQVRAVCPELERNILAEPLARNTLPAILLALDRIAPPGREAAERDTLVGVFPSDHMVGDLTAWAACLERGIGLAAAGRFVTFGVLPDKAEVGYGYIERGAALGPGAYAVTRFIEKPDPERARRFVEDGRHYWNSGMFVFPAGLFLEAVRTHAPAHWAWFSARETTPLVRAYGGLPAVSVDYGVAEKISGSVVVEARFDWDDLGNWEAIYRLGEKDARGNVLQGDVLALDCENCLFLSKGGKIAAVGLKDTIMVQTRDATLVCPLPAVQRVWEVVNRLKAEGSPLVESHVTVKRPWGSYTVLEEGPQFKIKRIEVLPGARLSLQMHHHRSEHWLVVSGAAQVEIGGEVRLLVENQSVDVPKATSHRLSNPGKVALELIEVQSGRYLEEDDIVRFDDVYGRVEKGDS